MFCNNLFLEIGKPNHSLVNRISLVKPEKARQVETYLIKTYQSQGSMKISDQQLQQLLNQVAGESSSSKIIVRLHCFFFTIPYFVLTIYSIVVKMPKMIGMMMTIVMMTNQVIIRKDRIPMMNKCLCTNYPADLFPWRLL